MKSMFRKGWIAILAIGSSTAVLAQGGDKGKREERVKQLKIGYFTEQLNLTTAESEKFWPVYNEMEDKIKELRKSNRELSEKLDGEAEGMKDEDYKKTVKAILDNDIAEANTKKEYYDKLAAIIGSKKAARTFKLEKEFKQMILKELKERPAGPPQPRPQRGGR